MTNTITIIYMYLSSGGRTRERGIDEKKEKQEEEFYGKSVKGILEYGSYIWSLSCIRKVC